MVLRRLYGTMTPICYYVDYRCLIPMEEFKPRITIKNILQNVWYSEKYHFQWPAYAYVWPIEILFFFYRSLFRQTTSNSILFSIKFLSNLFYAWKTFSINNPREDFLLKKIFRNLPSKNLWILSLLKISDYFFI